VSYACLATGFEAVCRIFAIRVPRPRLVAIGFVSAAMNHLVAVGGATGLSVRLLLLRDEVDASRTIVSASLLASYLNSMALVLLLPSCLAYLVATHRLSTRQDLVIGVTLSTMLALLGVATLFVLSPRWRRRLLGVVDRSVSRVRGGGAANALRAVDEVLEEGRQAVGARPTALVWPVALVAADWTASVLALAICFDALHVAIDGEVLVAGFVLGIAAGTLSAVPGGLGVQEGSMAGLYSLLGVPFEEAVLAAVLFRLVYYVLPFALSLPVYRRLASPPRRSEARARTRAP
jgi:uncharacterized protein (TIRG00374 family)